MFKSITLLVLMELILMAILVIINVYVDYNPYKSFTIINILFFTIMFYVINSNVRHEIEIDRMYSEYEHRKRIVESENNNNYEESRR